ncbi:protein zwilch homolog isoform X1 [Erpetoichthys calabaricus]|uniref:Protein zwilch n=1 Tax=Erpetoichthys calabaricus TaxID=27687 RepID=A0A8C4T7J8_ERPCA|nr:protein zwilch homolog isoform X1 [Erpetoichthys calabaricus]
MEEIASEFLRFLSSRQVEFLKGSLEPGVYETGVQVRTTENSNPLHNFWSSSKPRFIMEKFIPKFEENDETTEELYTNESKVHLEENVGPMGLSIMKARQLLSWYILSQNPNVLRPEGDAFSVALFPLWLRCDGCDLEGIHWLGAEIAWAGVKAIGVNIYTVKCKGPATGKASFPVLEELKQQHKIRHHSSAVTAKGYAQYDLFGSAVVENTIIESQSNVYVDFSWNNVESILQPPPLTATATLKIKVGSGDPRSPVCQLYRELEFLVVLADGLRTGVTDWPEPLESKTALQLVQALIDDLKHKLDNFQNSPVKETENPKESAANDEGSIHTGFVAERCDLDFAEQLWCRMWKSVSSYHNVQECLSLVIQALKTGSIQPWIHRGSNSTLSRLVQQSYDGSMDSVTLSGLVPIRMLLELGLDKMRKDYISYFLGQELATFNYLDYFLCNSVDLQEQVHRLKKLHHMLEIVVNCSAFLSLEHEHLFPLMQSLLQFYEKNPHDEEHIFSLPIRPSFISSFYQNAPPQMWRVELVSGHGQKEVKTIFQLSTKSAVDHMAFDESELHLKSMANEEGEETFYFTSIIECSQVHFV